MTSALKHTVDFAFAFATPHRLTVALPDSSHKTLLDLQPGFLRMAWSYDDLRNKPPASFLPPRTEWDVTLTPQLDGEPFGQSSWRRAGGWLPVLENVYGDETAGMRLEVVGGEQAAVVCVEVANHDSVTHRFALRCERPGGFTGVNPGWVQPDWDRDVLLAGWLERTDRILVFALGGDSLSVPGPTALGLNWELAPGEERSAWLVRPYQAYHASLPALRERDWGREFAAGIAAWENLIGRAARITLPDPDVQNAFYASLADCFVMREPAADGYIATCPGTEVYRATNPAEVTFVNILLDQVGLHAEASEGEQIHLDMQNLDGSWTYTQGWEHWCWGAAGFKAWTVMEHYRLTGDRAYLAAVYPRMLANARWQERQRARTRVLADGGRPLTYGLLPRGMGDGGLMGEDGSYYGVFLTHNILAVYADALALEAAQILGEDTDVGELEAIHVAGQADLTAALERGAIQEDGYRWIPGVPGFEGGSRWGALYAAFPSRILPPDHELITGTLRKIEARISPGGIPIQMGWQKDGLWVAMALDNLAEALLLRDEGDAAVGYLYATLNHGTALYSWCEERGQEPGAADCTGDRQHLWTPVAVGRFIRDALVMEDAGVLHLARATARQWLANGGHIGVQNIVTYFGRVSYDLCCDEPAGRLTGFVELAGSAPAPVTLHMRLPEGLAVASLAVAPGATLDAGRSLISWPALRGRTEFSARLERTTL